MINWVYFPQSARPNRLLLKIIDVFKKHADDVDSLNHEGQVSDEVLAKIAPSLGKIGKIVFKGGGRSRSNKLSVLEGSFSGMHDARS